MITRLMISLRKAAHSQELPWMSTINDAPGHGKYSLRFAPNRGALSRSDDEALESPISPGVRGLSAMDWA